MELDRLTKELELLEEVTVTGIKLPDNRYKTKKVLLESRVR